MLEAARCVESGETSEWGNFRVGKLLLLLSLVGVLSSAVAGAGGLLLPADLLFWRCVVGFSAAAVTDV